MERAAQPGPVRFVEPTEGAFSLVVPGGWRAEGGVARGASEPRPWYRVVSPGGGAELRGSDPRVPSFLDPSFGMMGMAVPTPGLVQRPYTPPVPFAAEYARLLARESGAREFELTGRRDVESILRDDPRPEARSRVHQMLQNGAEMAGVTFECPDRGLSGLVDVVTLRTAMPLGLWWSPILTALVGPTEAWPHVKATLLHIARSYATLPAWQQTQSLVQQAQHQMAMDTIATGTRVMNIHARSGMDAIAAHGHRAHLAAQTAAEMSAMQSQSWREAQASDDERQRRAVNAINEAVDLVDPATGQVYRGAPAGYASYWTDGADRVVASQGHDNPDPSRFTEAANLDDVPAPGRPPRR